MNPKFFALEEKTAKHGTCITDARTHTKKNKEIFLHIDSNIQIYFTAHAKSYTALDFESLWRP
jgi:hypothetical protein